MLSSGHAYAHSVCRAPVGHARPVAATQGLLRYLTGTRPWLIGLGCAGIFIGSVGLLLVDAYHLGLADGRASVDVVPQQYAGSSR